jgi:hypothetical protein
MRRPKKLLPRQPKPLLEVVVVVGLKAEEEVVVLSAALEAAVAQKQDLLLTPMVPNRLSTVRIPFLPLTSRLSEAGIPPLTLLLPMATT